MIARGKQDWNIGVSTWGQGDSSYLIPASSPFSIFKLFQKGEKSKTHITQNFTEYFNPAFTWTRKWCKGNIEGIIKSNAVNLDSFINDFVKPDVLIAQASYPAAVIANRLSKEYNIPFVVTVRMSPFPFTEFLTRKGSIKEIIKKPLEEADYLIATSNSLQERLHDFGFKKVRVINNPVDTEFFHMSPREKANECRILTIGRIEEQKGYDLLIKALSQLEIPFELRIGGDGSKTDEYKKLAKNLGIDERIIWLGILSREQVRDEMQACSFYVLSSRHETFGNVIPEAMACGKPIVSTRCGGPEDILNDKIGYLCENMNVEDLAEKIKLMINNHSQFSSEEIRKEVVTNFSPEVWLAQLESLFKEIVPK